MNMGRKSEQDVDRLLRQVLRDDLPPESENRLRARAAALRHALESSGNPRAVRSAGLWKRMSLSGRWRHRYLMYRKEALTYASAVMLTAGMVIHLGGYQSLMADSISLLKTSLHFEEQLRLARSMDCKIHMPAMGAQGRTIRIRWVREGSTRVDVVSPRHVAETLWIIKGQVTSANHDTDSASGASNQAAVLEEAAAALLSPTELSRRLNRNWQLRLERQQHDSGRLTYVDRQDRAVIEIRLDRASFLPVSLSRTPSQPGGPDGSGGAAITAEFVWNHPIEPELMAPHLRSGR